MEPGSGQAFVRHLLGNPALDGLSPLQKEEQVQVFLQAQAAELAPTLATGAFFPGLPWTQVQELLAEALRAETDRLLQPELETLTGLDFAFGAFLQSTPVPAQGCREELAGLLEKLLASPKTRQALCGPLAAVHWKLPDRYLEHCFADRQYVHFELTKVERLRLGPAEVTALVKVALLLRAAVFLHVTASRSTGLLEAQAAEKALRSLRAELKALPAAVLRAAVMSHLPFQGNPRLEACARLTAVFAALGRGYRPGRRADRGAVTPEASWFSVARRNHQFHGFDEKMLEELYKIAAENGW
jgi:hypothetical protein